MFATAFHYGSRCGLHYHGGVKSFYRKLTRVGGSTGLAVGLLFLLCAHTGFDFLVPFLFFPAFPCWWVAMKFNATFQGPERIAMAVGVCALSLLYAGLGLAVGVLKDRLRQRSASSRTSS